MTKSTSRPGTKPISSRTRCSRCSPTEPLHAAARRNPRLMERELQMVGTPSALKKVVADLHCPSNERTLGIDCGERRVGLALSDEMGIIASGIGTRGNDASPMPWVLQLLREARRRRDCDRAAAHPERHGRRGRQGRACTRRAAARGNRFAGAAGRRTLHIEPCDAGDSRHGSGKRNETQGQGQDRRSRRGHPAAGLP
ncbi:MAG: hypothetical protein MZV64_14795 [Ignavibacteriales bacterium]|nr:hypothetical protein [Ignavibacteriales bacterium]